MNCLLVEHMFLLPFNSKWQTKRPPNDPYYKDVQVNPIALASLPLILADISPLILHLNSNDTLSHQQSLSSTVQPPNSFEPYELESSSFISTQTNARIEVE